MWAVQHDPPALRQGSYEHRGDAVTPPNGADDRRQLSKVVNRPATLASAMAHHVIDLTTSSPPRRQSPTRSPSYAAPVRNDTASISRTPPEASSDHELGQMPQSLEELADRVNRPPRVDLNNLSDEFDSTSDLDVPVVIESIGSKRRRISLTPVNDTIGARVPADHLCNGQVSKQGSSVGQTARSSLEAIDVTSSPESPPSRSALDNQRLTAPRPARGRPRAAEKFLSSDFDPFATSPLTGPNTEEALPTAKRDASPDPFATSPQPEPAASDTHVEPTDAVNPQRRLPRAPSPRKYQVPKQRRQLEPISSSAPESMSLQSPGATRTTMSHLPTFVIHIDDSDLEEKSDEALPDIADIDMSQPRPRHRSPLRRSRSENLPPKNQRAKKSAPSKSAEERAKEREARSAAKEIEKEKKRQERQEARETKAREKEHATAIAEANKVRTDKKVSAPEMIVDLPAGLGETMALQVKTLLEDLGVQHQTSISPVANAIRWRRKVTSRFNEDLGHWVPSPLRIETEMHLVIVMNADEVVRLAQDAGLEQHATDVERCFPGFNTMYLIEGLVPWMRKNRNSRNRQFTSGVRAQVSTTGAANSRRRRVGATQEYVEEDIVEDALLQLQVEHDVRIHHSTIPLETAQWITAFTQHISTIPYKRQRDQATLGAGFCMESGQVRTGDDAADTYVRMLQEIARVTAPVAYGVAAEFSTVSKLVCGLQDAGPMRLESVKKCVDKEGTVSDRTVGQAMSRRLHKVFTGREETSTDI